MSRELPTLAVFEDDIGVPRTLLETLSLLIAMLALTPFAGLILCLALLTVLYATGANWVTLRLLISRMVPVYWARGATGHRRLNEPLRHGPRGTVGTLRE